ncbi:MAG: InlB B-repeat-containing protein, partial [Paludibacteraceae bacterium]|nr:InlB B-repeat-containing protein [Paludibacteraceae bacterium]
MNTKSNLLKSIFISLILVMGVNNAWGLGYNNESHVYLDVNGTTKYYKVSSEDWGTGCSLPGTWGGELKNQTFNDVQNLTIKGGAVGGKTAWQESLSATLSYSVTTSTTTPSSWTNFGSITSSSTYNNDACFYYKNNGSTNVTPTTPGTYYLHIKISFNSTSKTSYVKFTIPASTYTVAGSKAVLGSDWNQSDTNNDMTLSSGTTYTLTKHDVSLTKGINYECKVVKDHSWENAWPSKNYVFSVNTDGHYDVTFTFDSSNKTVSVATTRLYAVIYDGNGKTSGTVPATTYHKSGSTITVANNSGNLAKSGYTFEGWNENAGGTGTSYAVGSTFSMPSADKTLYAKWTLSEQQYTVTAVANPTAGGTVTPTSATAMGQVSGGKITATANTGYTFNNWSIKSGSGSFTDAKAASTTFKPTAVSTVQANFTANKYTVKFHENGGEGEMTDQGFTYDEKQKLTENAFKRENALFVGWATSEGDANNGVVAYTNGQSVSNLTETKDGVVNLYAVWATISITVCPERIKLNDQLTLTISYKNIPENYIYRVYITSHNQPVPNNNGEWITISGSGTLTHTSKSGHYFTAGENNVVVQLYNQNHTILLLTSEAKTFIAEQIGTIAVYTRKEAEGDVFYTNLQNVSASFGVSITAPTIDGYRFDRWEEISGGIVFTPNTYSSTVTVTASNGGQIRAYYKKLEPKTIYLKTVEGTTDGVNWYVKYNGTEYIMDELGCTNEYYKGVVPEGTSFQFVSKDNNNATVETKGTDLQYVEGKTLYNLVSAAASGNKIFFKPNQQWIDKAAKEKWHFAGSFWTDSAVWKEMTDDNSDGIYECEKPANAIQVIFCLVYTTNNIENWGNDWSYRKIQTDGDNAYKKIPNGSNLFIITDNKEDQAIGTWSTHADTPVNGEGEWTTFTGITYRITLNQQDATTAGTTHVDVAYHASMPEIEKLPTKTEKKFGGYYTQQNGQGVILVNAFGEWQDANGYISSTTWESEDCITLYAYWKNLEPEITDITLNTDIFEPVEDENEKVFVTAEPTIETHNNNGQFVVCWKLLYTNGREVEGEQYKATPVEGNKVRFSIAGLSTGTYTIRASLHTGNDCGSGEEISRFDKQFSIVANRIITVNYTCDGNTIMASTKQNAHIINPTSITAPDIVGYTFKEWVAGDGVIISTADKTQNAIEFTAYYDGNLTATYTKKKMVYFYNTMGWDNVYVYFYSSDKYWDTNMGSGSDKNKEIDGTKAHWFEYRGKMTQIQGTNIWYFDYLSLGGEIEGYTNVVFNKYQQDNYEWFHNTEVVRRGDMDANKLPMYVPIKAAAETKNGTNYYNKGYWMNYPENTGYKLQIYDGTGNGAKEVASVRFPYSTNTIMPLTVSVDLEAGKTYGFKILREDNTYFSNSGTMTANSNGWSFTYGVSQNCGLKTTLAGDYTFTLKFATPNQQDPNDYKYCVDVVYPVSVGDYRVVYQDDAQWSQSTAHDKKWNHPSYAIKN